MYIKGLSRGTEPGPFDLCSYPTFVSVYNRKSKSHLTK